MLRKLIKKQQEIDRMFDELIEELRKYLPDLGRYLSTDSKKVENYARGNSLNRGVKHQPKGG